MGQLQDLLGGMGTHAGHEWVVWSNCFACSCNQLGALLACQQECFGVGAHDD